MSERFGLVVFLLDWSENNELHPDHPDNVTVRAAVEASWIYSAAEGDWIKRVRHCLHLAPQSSIVVTRGFMALDEFRALTPDAEPIPDSPAKIAKRARRKQRLRERRGQAHGPQLFIDLDGVLADFDGFYADRFGVRPDRRAGPDPPDFWANIDSEPDFFGRLPMLPDARELWEGACVLHTSPIILTGIPDTRRTAELEKRAWVAQHISDTARVICCRSKDKRLHGRPGDVLVDDWPKYRGLWEAMGGIFVLHTSASDTLAQLARVQWGAR
jgi:hypothetical protein